MIKLRHASTEQERLAAITEYVSDHASHVLNQAAQPMASEDAALLNLMQEGLAEDLQQLERLFAFTLNDAARETASQIVGKLILRAHGIGAFAVHSPEAEQWRGMVRGMQMRNGKAMKPERIALEEAVNAVFGTGHATNAYKEAGAILDAVNKHLQQAGFKPVLIDKVYRILDKRSPRS